MTSSAFETLPPNGGAALHVTLNRPETQERDHRDMVRDLTALADLLAQDRDTARS